MTAWSVRPVGRVRSKRDLRALASAAERERRTMALYLARFMSVSVAEAERIYARADLETRERYREAQRTARRHQAMGDADAGV